MADETSQERKYPRLALRHMAIITSDSGQERQKAKSETRSVSLGGCSLELEEALEEGTEVTLFLACDYDLVKTAARVAYSRPLEEGRYEIGVEFAELSPDDREAIAGLLERQT